jgi:hypothetical protein
MRSHRRTCKPLGTEVQPTTTTIGGDEDDRDRKPEDEGGVVYIRRTVEKISEQGSEIPAHVLERMKAMRQRGRGKRKKSLKQLYAWSKHQVESSIAEADQTSRQTDILQQLRVGSRYSSASPRMQTAMLEYVTQVDSAMLSTFSGDPCHGIILRLE